MKTKTLKTVAILFIAIIFPFILNAENEKLVNSKVKNVTVFLNAAQVSRTGNFTVEQGITDLIFEGVSPYLNTKSIQVKGFGKYTIIDVQYRIKYPEPKLPENIEIPAKIVRDIKLLEDSISILNFDLEDVRTRTANLKMEQNILLQNKLIQGNTDTIPELKLAMEYLRKQLLDINSELSKLKRQEFLLSKVYYAKQERLTELKSYNSKVNPVKTELPKYQIVVTVSADYATDGNMNVEYLVNNAGWTPEYDIRAEGIDKPINLVYKANVFQNSGENWENVKLRLSTLSPNENKTKPNLTVQYLNFIQYQIAECTSSRQPMAMLKQANSVDYSKDESAMTDMPSAGYSYQYTQQQQTMTNIEYDIKLDYSIPSDGQYHKVAIQNQELKTEYFHYLVPRLDKQAFLIAKITDWGKYDLLSANANIYFEGTYVGETQINTSIMKDTMELSLGKDRSIFAERIKNIDNVRNVLIGVNQIKTIEYNIKIKNNKTSVCNLIIEDQMPVSQSKEIIVTPLETSKSEFNKTTGMMIWRTKINAGETKNFKFSFEIESDKNKALVNL